MDRALCHIALGSNVGDRAANINSAIDAITRLEGVDLIARSPLYETEALVQPGSPPQREYYNGAIAVETSLDARTLLRELHRIEQILGRDRIEAGKWRARTIDLDILLWGDVVIDEPGLTIPHPRLHERRFVLEPLCDIASDARHPILERSVRELLDALGPSTPRGGAPAALRVLAIIAALFIGSAPIARAQVPDPASIAQPAPLDPEEVFRAVVAAHRIGPIADRVSLTAVSTYRERTQSAAVYLDAKSDVMRLELGALTAVARDGELRVIQDRRADRYARFTGASVAASIADVLPPLPMPHLALAFDDPDEPIHLTPFGVEINWTAAWREETGGQVLLHGEGEDVTVTYVVDGESWRLKAGVVTTPGAALRIEMEFEPIEPGDPAQWAIDTSARTPVETLGQLRTGGVDILPGAPAPAMALFTIASEPWRLENDQEGPVALVFFREASQTVLAARDALERSIEAHDAPIDIQPVLVAEKLVGIDLFERIGLTVQAWGSPVLWSVSRRATIDRFTSGPACVALIDADRTVRDVIHLGADGSRRDEAARIEEVVAEFSAEFNAELKDNNRGEL